jgi:hypothetical protein
MPWRVAQDKIHDFKCPGKLGPFPDIPKCFIWCVWMLFSLKNLLEHQMDWIKMIVMNWKETKLKNVKNVEFSKTCFSQVKWWGYDLFSVTMSLEWLWKLYMSLNLVLLWKWLSFWKRGKWHEFKEFLELNGIKLWCGYVWTTIMICDIWTCFVDWCDKAASARFIEVVIKRVSFRQGVVQFN